MTLHSLFVHLGATLISGVHDDSTSRSTSFCALRMDSSSPRVQHVVPASFFEASLLVRHPGSSTCTILDASAQHVEAAIRLLVWHDVLSYSCQ